MSGSAYWAREIKRRDAKSPKEGAIRRMDRLRGSLRNLDPVVANRAWLEIADALQAIHDRYAK